jgi:hypothetical protein
MRKLILILALAIILTSCIVMEEVEEPQEQIKEDVQQVVEEKQPEVIAPEPVEEPVKEVKGYIAENLEIPEKYWYYDTNNDIGATVYGNDRASMWEEVSKKHDLALWNPDTKELYILFGQISKYGLSEVREGVDYQRGDDEYYMAYMKETMKSYPWGPVDWMIEMKDAIPVTIDKSEQVLHVENRYYTSNLALTYKKGNEGAILHFDSHYNVPVVVERLLNGATVERIKYYYDNVAYDELNRKPKQITKEMVTLPDDAVILTMDEARAYVKGEYFRDPVSVNPIIMHANVIQAFGLKPGSTV